MDVEKIFSESKRLRRPLKVYKFQFILLLKICNCLCFQKREWACVYMISNEACVGRSAAYRIASSKKLIWEQFGLAVISGVVIIAKPQRTFVRFCARFDVREGESESQMMINGEAALQTVCVDVLKTTCSESF